LLSKMKIRLKKKDMLKSKKNKMNMIKNWLKWKKVKKDFEIRFPKRDGKPSNEVINIIKDKIGTLDHKLIQLVKVSNEKANSKRRILNGSRIMNVEPRKKLQNQA
jgi:hypothetical protein